MCAIGGKTDMTHHLTDWLGRLEAAIREAQSDGAIDPVEDPAQLAFDIEAALFLANAQYVLARNATPIHRARQAIRRRITLAAPVRRRDASTRRAGKGQ